MLAEHKTTRKIFKVKAALTMPTTQPVLVRTLDIGASGMSVSVPDLPLPMGVAGTIRFDLLVDGKPTPISTGIKVASCIFSGGEFKVSLQFTGLDTAASSALNRFMR